MLRDTCFYAPKFVYIDDCLTNKTFTLLLLHITWPKTVVAKSPMIATANTLDIEYLILWLDATLLLK